MKDEKKGEKTSQIREARRAKHGTKRITKYIIHERHVNRRGHKHNYSNERNFI
jgi:hypothetical protein